MERDIENLLYRCGRSFDEGDIDAMAECYAADAALVSPEGTIAGRAAIADAMSERRALRVAGGRRPHHLVTNVEVEPIGPDAARTRAAYTLLIAGPDGVEIASTGTYADELVRVDGAWRIRAREVVPG